MKFLAASVTLLSLLASASAVPTTKRAAPGPSGQVLVPAGGATWDNTGGWGLGHVVYQGVSEAYENSAGVNHVRTHHIDLYLEAQDGSGETYYLAKGLAPNNLTIDAEFQIPVKYGGRVGAYWLVIEETQIGSTPGKAIPITFRAAAPTVNIVAGP